MQDDIPPKKILLAEDDADDREVFYKFLKNRSDVFLLSAVENGEEVLDILSGIITVQELPDLILLDQKMPKKNGLQTLQSLKESHAFEQIPVFIYSTYTDEALHQQSANAGAVFVFLKPYTSEGYHKMVDAMLHLIG